MSSKAARQRWRDKRTADIEEMIRETGFDCKWITPYQCRVWAFDTPIDFYPTNGRYCVLSKGFWGHYHTYQDLFKVIDQETQK